LVTGPELVVDAAALLVGAMYEVSEFVEESSDVIRLGPPLEFFDLRQRHRDIGQLLAVSGGECSGQGLTHGGDESFTPLGEGYRRLGTELAPDGVARPACQQLL
jgi:hypothetical protein